MTDNWTPSTEQVRSHYVFDQSNRWEPERGEAFDRWLNRVRAEAIREFRQRLINRQVKQYGIVLPDIHEIVDDLDHVAYCIEQNSEGNET